jgi:hypothetical protein
MPGVANAPAARLFESDEFGAPVEGDLPGVLADRYVAAIDDRSRHAVPLPCAAGMSI